MTIVLPLILISLAAGAVALATFLWSVSNGQYDDMEGAAERMLMDDDGHGERPDRSS